MKGFSNPKTYLLVAPWILLSLIAGLLAGLYRIGWDIPVSTLSGAHGLIMAGGFLGTVICFEKTFPTGKLYYLIFPATSGISIIFLIVGNMEAALWLQLFASLGLVISYFWWIRQTREPFYRIMMMGALGWVVATAGLIGGRSIILMVPWWMMFILFTIIGERIELSRFLPTKKYVTGIIYLSLFTYAAGLFFRDDYGVYVSAAALIVIPVILLKFDIIKVTITKSGQYKYIAILLLTGYIWMLLTGVFMFAGNFINNSYDIITHSFFLGFTFTMIFAHGPIILPGFMKQPITIFTNSLYYWFALFQVSLIVRIVSDMLQMMELRKFAGLANAVFILMFFINIIYNAKKALKASSK